MNSDSEQTSRDDGSTNKHIQNRSTSKGTAWEYRLCELADYRKSSRARTAMFLKDTAKTPTWVHGSQPKGVNTGCTWKERHRL
jgi:hypothetical protein